MKRIPSGLAHWTADEVAECLSVSDSLYRKLWQILGDAKNPTPAGGDGSDGTVETPCGRLDLRNDDKAKHWWKKLNDSERAEIATAFAKAQGGCQ